MQGDFLKNRIFEELFFLPKTEYLRYSEEEAKVVENILKENDYYIELIPPEIQLHGPIQSDGGSLVNLPTSKIYFSKTVFDNQTDYNLDKLKNRNNPIIFYNEVEQFKLSPFIVKTGDIKYNDYILFSEVKLGNSLLDLKGNAIINFRLSYGNIDFISDKREIEVFPIFNKNMIVVIDVKNEIAKISNGKHRHFTGDKLDYKFEGSFFSYSIFHTKIEGTKKNYSSHDYRYKNCVMFGLFDIYANEAIYSAYQGAEKQNDGYFTMPVFKETTY